MGGYRWIWTPNMDFPGMDILPWTPVMGIFVNCCHGHFPGRLTWTPVMNTGINPSFLWYREHGRDRVSITSPDEPPGMDPRHEYAVMEILSYCHGYLSWTLPWALSGAPEIGTVEGH